jgi:hypothetical protein
VASFTGGRYQPTLRDVFDPHGRTVPSTLRLWPALLVLALLLNLAELILRKWRGLWEGFRSKRSGGAPPAVPEAGTRLATASRTGAL